jgi:chemotaxis signal transduction protein
VIVDSINSVLSPAENELSGKPEVQGSKAGDYIINVYRKDKKLVLFLDIAKVLSVEDLKTIKNGMQQQPQKKAA